jgi:hypothetical protein
MSVERCRPGLKNQSFPVLPHNHLHEKCIFRSYPKDCESVPEIRRWVVLVLISNYVNHALRGFGEFHDDMKFSVCVPVILSFA